MKTDLMETIYMLREHVSRYSDASPAESITEIRMKPAAFSRMRHSLHCELSPKKDFFGTDGIESFKDNEFRIYGITFRVDENHKRTGL